MGTRADFYIEVKNEMEWLGSIAWDGMPSSIPPTILHSKTPKEFRTNVNDFLDRTTHATTPSQGWPWPWATSDTTDYSYVLIERKSKVLAQHFRSRIFDPLNENDNLNAESEYDGENPSPENQRFQFPDMSDKQNVTFGHRSGLIIIGGEIQGD
jgi:hypothetical protein